MGVISGMHILEYTLADGLLSCAWEFQSGCGIYHWQLSDLDLDSPHLGLDQCSGHHPVLLLDSRWPVEG